MDNNFEHVVLLLWKYDELLKKSGKYDELIQKMIETSELSWSKDRLRFGGIDLSVIIKGIEPELYEDRLHRLISEDKKKNKEVE